MDVFLFLFIGFHILVRVLVLKKRDEFATSELRSSDRQGLCCGSTSNFQVGFNTNIGLFKGDLGGCFGMCTDQTSAMSGTKAVAR